MIPAVGNGIPVERAVEKTVSSRAIDLSGLKGGCLAPFLVKYRERLGRPVIVVTEDAASARALHRDLVYHEKNVSPEESILLFPAYDIGPYDEMIPERRFAMQRSEVVFRLSKASGALRFVVVSAEALVRKTVPRAAFDAGCRKISFGDRIDRDELISHLTRNRYYKTPLVEEPGSFAARGSLVDIFPPYLLRPVRVDFFGSDIERIREFDPETQLGDKEVESVWFHPVQLNIVPDDTSLHPAIAERLRTVCDAVNQPSQKTSQLIDDMLHGRLLFAQDRFFPACFLELGSLFDYFPRDAAFCLENPGGIRRALTAHLFRLTGEYERLCAEHSPSFPPSRCALTHADVEERISNFPSVRIHALAVEGEDDEEGGEGGDLSRFASDVRGEVTASLHERLHAAALKTTSAETVSLLSKYLKSATEAGYTIVLVAHTTGQAERLASMLKSRGVVTEQDDPHLWTRRKPGVRIAEGELARGCILPADGLIWIAEEEIFGRRTRRAKSGAKPAKAPLEDLKSLCPGDLVVHLEHGIGKYEGLVRQKVRGAEMDFLLISYRDGDKLYLPVYRLNQVQKYRGGGGPEQTLDRLGGQTFQASLTKAKKAAMEMAGRLLTLYAQRATATKTPISDVDDMYREFEAAFPFEETDDQARAIDETLADLRSEKPMDRLVCGDVGFGKTEVAMRAAFLTAMGGGQTAVLVPTTVLAQQHYQTFKKRFAPYPIRIEMLSRFRSAAKNNETVRAVKEGGVDIAVGTHRLLSKDVHFKNLRLLIIDEEHRFGVAHKERIRSLRASVDTLTLTATPIPRTLQMAFGGIRDLSLIATPPAERRPIKTMICLNDPSVLKRAIEHELSRGGQVFFVHNRVHDIFSIADKVKEMVPEAVIGVGHGQMKESALEQVMLDFTAGKYNVLVCTTIIESGLDIPRANTIIIHRADTFGMAQLYQLRGRVGRSDVQAYAYLVIPPSSAMTDDARDRVETLARYTDLGAGFSVATMDMEIRGAGNLIGPEQSGNVAGVGIEMFCDLLEQAAAELRGAPIQVDIEPELTLDKPGYLPEEYIPDVGRRLEFYKRLASSVSEEEVESIAADLRDRFGVLPGETEDLVAGMAAKAICRRLKVRGLEVSTKGLVLHLTQDTRVDPDAVIEMVRETSGRVRLSADLTVRAKFRPDEEGGVKGVIHFLHRLEGYGNNLAIS